MNSVSYREYRDRFYRILDELAARLGGGRVLAECDGRMPWPRRGVYFFLEPGELRGAGSGPDQRVVRVGTHAVSAGSGTTLWQRLKQHQGTGGAGESAGGNHRGSVFRDHVGMALIRSGRCADLLEAWATTAPTPEMRAAEMPLEQLVSEHLGRMRVLWVEADDAPGTASVRRYVEANSVALLSQAAFADPPSPSWLGRHAARDAIRTSGLWNVQYVGEPFEPAFLDVLEDLAVHTALAGPAHQEQPRVEVQPTPTVTPPTAPSEALQEPVLALISCTKKKAAGACRAKDLYAPSSFFRMAYEVAQRGAQHTLILSAKHGVVHPDDLIAPYEQTLVGAGRAERRQWALATYQQLSGRPEYMAARTVLWFAGENYREDLMPLVLADGKQCSVPMEGLAQGEQLSWLCRQGRAEKLDLTPVLPAAAPPLQVQRVRVERLPANRDAGAPPRSAEDFRNALERLLAGARQRSESSLTIRAGDLHRLVGGYPGPSHRMPVCCRVMRGEMRVGDTIVSAPPRGDGASLTVCYIVAR